MERRFTISTESTGDVIAMTTSENQKTAEAIWNALPIKSRANLWGDEIYFPTPVKLKQEKGREEFEIGSIAYWPPGCAICIFFGATPASIQDEPHSASPVNVFAKIIGDASIFKKVQGNEQVLLKK